jgi:predicted glycosyltransferase
MNDLVRYIEHQPITNKLVKSLAKKFLVPNATKDKNETDKQIQRESYRDWA